MEGSYIAKINNRCNANCIFCADPPEERRKPGPEWPALIEGLKKSRKEFESLIITGGEPLIHERVIDYIRAAKRLGYSRISVATNGILLYYRDFAEKLSAAGAGQFQISYQTTESKDYGTIACVRNCSGYVEEAIDNLNMLKIPFSANTVIHRLNYRKLDSVVRHLASKNAERIQLSFLNPVGTGVVAGKSGMLISFSEALPFIRAAFDAADSIGYRKLEIENMPSCMAPELMDRISDLRKPQANKDYYNACKKKPGRCRSCIHSSICDGVWEAYLKQKGESELRPIIPTSNSTSISTGSSNRKTKK